MDATPVQPAPRVIHESSHEPFFGRLWRTAKAADVCKDKRADRAPRVVPRLPRPTARKGSTGTRPVQSMRRRRIRKPPDMRAGGAYAAVPR